MSDMLDRSLRNRYSRQVMFPAIGEEGQARLLRSRAVIIGCGALGCSIATLLVRAGVGNIRLVDRDFIELHNLQRQTLFDEDDIAARLPKAVAAERHLRKVNSSIEIEGVVADVNYSNIEAYCKDADAILDGLDNFETRFLINDAALKLKLPWVYGGVAGSTGMTMTIVPGKSPCFRCVFPRLPELDEVPNCETAGIVGSVPNIIGALEATEAMKLLVGAELNRKATMVDVWDMAFYSLTIRQRDDCPACQGTYEFLGKRFEVKTTPLCGQSRAVQVVDTRLQSVNLGEIAASLQDVSDVSKNEFMLRFKVDKHEITAFPDGRAIIGNTNDESLAKELYRRYIERLN